MGYVERMISRAYAAAEPFIVDDQTKLVFMSDCHRGDGTQADTFLQNQNICFFALDYYYRRGFTYVELGDGDELWENRSLEALVDIHGEIYWQLSRFYALGRLKLVYGNHDMLKKYAGYCSRHLSFYYDMHEKRHMPLFPGLRAQEALRLRHRDTGREILALHGHQGDILNDALWRLGRFLVRYFWRPLELFGAKDLTRAGTNAKKAGKTEKRLAEWAKRNQTPVIAGHTHRPWLKDGDNYYNDGSCVHPRCITALEIEALHIKLIKWAFCVNEDGFVHVCREELAGPKKLFL